MSVYTYDLFISYATPNREIANYIVDKIEKEGFKCYIAPRDINGGEDYASELIKGISNSSAMLIVFSSHSDQSGYCLREINSAVSRNKTLIPMRIENFLPSEAMEFYLGPTHWLDCFPDLLDKQLGKVIDILKGINASAKPSRPVKYLAPTIINYEGAREIGLNYRAITARTIELDYLCIPKDKFNMSEEIEGRYEEWETTAKHYEEETSLLLLENDVIIGYTDIYPIIDKEYASLIAGKVIVRGSMIDITSFGGEFNFYIAMIALDPHDENIKNYLHLLNGIIDHFIELESRKIVAKSIGVSVYSDMLEKFLVNMCFEFRNYNPANGKVYEISYDKLKTLPIYAKRSELRKSAQ